MIISKLVKTTIAVIAVAVAEGGRRLYRQYKQTKRQECVNKSCPERKQEEDNKESQLIFHERREPFNLSDFVEVDLLKSEKEEWIKFVSDNVGILNANAALGNSFSGLLKCDTCLSQLAQSKDGFLRGFVLENGKFVKQAKFEEVKYAISTPLMAFQLASIITGQYYQHVITQQIKLLSQQLNEIIARLDAKNIASMQHGYHSLLELIQLKEYSEIDCGRAEKIADSMNELRLEYRELLKGIKLDISYGFSDYNEVVGKIGILEESKFFNYMQQALMAETIYYLSNVLLIRMYNGKESKEKISNIEMRLSCDFFEPYNDVFLKIRHNVLKYIELAKKSALIQKEKITKLDLETNQKFEELKLAFTKQQQSLDVKYCYVIDVQEGEFVKLLAKPI